MQSQANPAGAEGGFAIASRTPPVFVDREAEAQCLHAAIRKRESLLIGGPAGIGKTALVLKILDELSVDSTQSFLYFSNIGGLHELLRRIAQRLFEVKDITLRRQFHVDGVNKSTFKAWLNAQSASRLKGALYPAVENRLYWIFLDHFLALTDAMAKVMKELVRMRNTPVYLLARGFTERENGHVAEIYWNDQQRLTLTPLSKKAATELIEHCVNHYGLLNLNLDGFRNEILRLSGQIPGAIVKMCELAAEPRYQFGNRIKTKLLHIDYLTRGFESDSPGFKARG